MRFSFNSNSTLLNRNSNHSTKVSSPRILSHKHLTYFPLLNCTLFKKTSLLLIKLSATSFLSDFIVIKIITLLILLILVLVSAKLIYIRIPISKRNAEMHFKKLDFITMREIIIICSILTLQ